MSNTNGRFQKYQPVTVQDMIEDGKYAIQQMMGEDVFDYISITPVEEDIELEDGLGADKEDQLTRLLSTFEKTLKETAYCSFRIYYKQKEGLWIVDRQNMPKGEKLMFDGPTLIEPLIKAIRYIHKNRKKKYKSSWDWQLPGGMYGN